MRSRTKTSACCGVPRILADRSDRREALRLWCRYQPLYIVSWVSAVKEASRRSRWGEVRALLNRMEGCVENLDASDRLSLGWYAVRARPRKEAVWQRPYTLPNYGLTEGNTPLTTLRMVAQWITYTSPTREPAQVTEELLPLLDRRGLESKNPSAVALIVRASAMMGRLLRYRDRKDFAGAEIAVPPSTLALFLEALWCKGPDWRNLPHEEVRTPGKIGSALAEIAWECGAPYRQLLHDIAKARFAEVMLSDEGTRLFDMLWEFNERAFLSDAVTAKGREVIEHLHEDDTSSRNAVIANLLHFARRLEIRDMATQLADRLRRTRIGYTSHKEWVFQPLVRWFHVLRKSSPAAWRSDGVQLLALDRICEQQGGDNHFSDEVTAEVGAAAMECGPNDFEALFDFLAARETKYSLSDLANAARDGFELCLSEQQLMSEESTLSRVALAIALGRWPRESALKTVSSLLTAHRVPGDVTQQPAWQKAVLVAAEIQGVPPQVEPGESSDEHGGAPESRSAEAILDGIIHPPERSWMHPESIASLAEQARAERHPNRDGMLATALSALESAGMLSRWLEFHQIDTASRLYRSLTESERWRLMGAFTSITGEMRKEQSDPKVAFMVAFSAVDLTCRARSADAGQEFAGAAFHQLLETHWKWHGVSAPTSPMMIRNTPSTWPDAAKRMLLTLMQTDACETFYMAMSGLRFFAESFPNHIPSICRAGLADEGAKDAILALAQLWATRNPSALAPAMDEFTALETTGPLDDRLDAWAVGALHNLVTGRRPRSFSIPVEDESPEIAFPGDGQLFEGEAQMNGLLRHNSFARMANERLRRASRILGPMDRAYRHMARAVKQGTVEFPSMILPPPRNLALDSSYPRQPYEADRIVGEAIVHQCAGKTWSPAAAAAVRLLIGFGVDPWIASATPNLWPDKEAWPSDFDIEPWLDAGAPKTADVGLRLTALLEGHDLDSSMLLLGAVLHIPTYRRDVKFLFWLADGTASDNEREEEGSFTRSGRTLAAWLAGWSFAVSKPSGATAVHFVGTLVNYPNSDLDVTPTDQWKRRWGWRPDPENCLRFRSKDGPVVAWYERWLRPDASSRQLHRQPFLNRWVARRDSFPAEDNELRAWVGRREVSSGPLSQPE